MSILSELRYPTRWYTRLLTAVLALLFFAVLATAGVAGFLVYRIVKPGRTSSEINLQSFPGRPDAVLTFRGAISPPGQAVLVPPIPGICQRLRAPGSMAVDAPGACGRSR